MVDHSTYFEPTAGGLTLTNAILLYRQDASRTARPEAGAAFASIHDVSQKGGKPTIGTGAPMSEAHLRQWVKMLGQHVKPEILPERVLVAHADLIAWWVPAHSRTAYFHLSQPPKDAKALGQRTTVRVPYPPHLFVATRGGLAVYALPKDERPTAETQLLHSPILNVFLDGQLCWGNIAKPRTLTVAAIPEYERAVFDSWSTHPNHGQESTVKGKGGLTRLWDDLAATQAKRFPVARLKPFMAYTGHARATLTFGVLVAGIGRA
jgi:PRTRC genetic system protein B